MKKAVIIFLLIFSASSIVQSQHNIQGRVLDERNFPVPKLSIYISNGGTAVTDNDGYFKASAGSLPYNLTIYDASNNNAVFYSSLSRKDPELIFFGSKSTRYTNTEVVKVITNPIPNGRNAIIKFISDDIFYSQDVYMSSGETSKILTVDWPSKSDYINGRVIYLERTSKGYEKYGERTITVTKGQYPMSVIFDSSLVYQNPGTSNITVYLPSASDYESKGFKVYTDFLSLHRNAQIIINQTEGNIISTKVNVPTNLSLGYRLKISGEAFRSDGSGFISYTYSYPGSSLNIESYDLPYLDAPQDKYWGVSTNTIFSYEWGSGTGIYVVHFHAYDPVGDFYIVTRDKNIPSPLGYSSGTLSGNEYSWSVAKYIPYISTDDYTKPRVFANDLGFKAILFSDKRTFRIKPF